MPFIVARPNEAASTTSVEPARHVAVATRIPNGSNVSRKAATSQIHVNYDKYNCFGRFLLYPAPRWPQNAKHGVTYWVKPPATMQPRHTPRHSARQQPRLRCAPWRSCGHTRRIELRRPQGVRSKRCCGRFAKLAALVISGPQDTACRPSRTRPAKLRTLYVVFCKIHFVVGCACRWLTLDGADIACDTAAPSCSCGALSHMPRAP